jgi:hypothetical protein
MNAPTVAIIDLKARLLWLDDGRCVPITNTFDEFGDECADADEIVRFYGGSRSIGWFGGSVSDFRRPTLH